MITITILIFMLGLYYMIILLTLGFQGMSSNVFTFYSSKKHFFIHLIPFFGLYSIIKKGLDSLE
jgi:hypothetical protein